MMSKIIITETQYQKLLETGAANAAMDLDIYVQQVDRDTSHGNESVIESIDDIVSKLEELKSMFATGKKVHSSLKNHIFSLNDNVRNLYGTLSSEV